MRGTQDLDTLHPGPRSFAQRQLTNYSCIFGALQECMDGGSLQQVVIRAMTQQVRRAPAGHRRKECAPCCARCETFERPLLCGGRVHGS